MSYESSIYFNPTALLMIKNEIDRSINVVEQAVNTLVEENNLPFGIDDALMQFEQCARVLSFINMPFLARMTDLSAQLMRKIMQQPQHIKTSDVVALSRGTATLKRYLEFVCLREVKVNQLLIDTLNRLEIALGQPQTRLGAQISPLLDQVTPQFEFEIAAPLEPSNYVHQLYKICLHKLLNSKAKTLDFQAFELIGQYLVSLSSDSPSKTYWQLVHHVLAHVEHIKLNEARLRVLIFIETQIADFLAAPHTFEVTTTDLADIIYLCLTQDDDLSHTLRQQLNIGEGLLSDVQLKLFSRQLYSADYATIHAMSELIQTAIIQLRNDIEFNYETMNMEKVQTLQENLKDFAHTFRLLDLDEIYHKLKTQSDLLNEPEKIHEACFAQQLISDLQNALNSIEILERRFLPKRLQLPVNNIYISLDRLDHAQQTLLSETKALLNVVIEMVLQLNAEHLDTDYSALALHIYELSGAALFLGSPSQQTALLETAQFIEQQQQLRLSQTVHILNVLASLDMLVDNLQNKQPVLQQMIDVALKNSQQLRNTAA